MTTLRLDLDALEVISFAIPCPDEAAGAGEKAFAPHGLVHQEHFL